MSTPQVNTQYVPAGSFYVRSDQVNNIQQVYSENPEAVKSIPAGAYVTGTNQYGGVNYTMTAPEGAHVTKPTRLTELATVASQPTTSEQATAQGYSGYIPQERKDIYYNQVSQQVASEQQQEARVRASEEAAQRLNLPPALGSQYDLTQVESSIPVGQRATGEYQIAEMSGPLQPGQRRPTALLVKTEVNPNSPQSISLMGPSDNPELDAAKYRTLQLANTNALKPGAGTSPVTKTPQQAIGNIEAITANLSPENKQLYQEWQQERQTNIVRNFGLTIAAVVVAPALGVTGLVTTIVVGAGLTQGIKAASQVASGQQPTLLTSQELFEGVTTGIIFGGVSKIAIGAVEGAGIRGLTKTSEAGTRITVGGEMAVNAGVGATGSAVLSGGDPRATAEGAVFGMGIGLAGRGITAFADRVFGVKEVHIKNVTEASKTEQIGNTKVTERITEINLQEGRTPISEAKQFQASKATAIDLAGTQKTTTLKLDASGELEQVTTMGRVTQPGTSGAKETLGTRKITKTTTEDLNFAQTSKVEGYSNTPVKGVTETDVISGIIKNEIDDSISNTVAALGQDAKKAPVWKVSPTAQEISNTLSGEKTGREPLLWQRTTKTSTEKPIIESSVGNKMSGAKEVGVNPTADAILQNKTFKVAQERTIASETWQQSSSSRNPEPILEAVNKEQQGLTMKMSKAESGNISDFTEFPSAIKGTKLDVKATEVTKVTSGRGRVYEDGIPKSNRVALLTEKKVIAADNVWQPETKVTVRKFDTITMRGKVVDDTSLLEVKGGRKTTQWDGSVIEADKSTLVNALPKELAQKIYTEQGGGLKQMGMPKAEESSFAMKPGSNNYFRNESPVKAPTKSSPLNKAPSVPTAVTEQKPVVKSSSDVTFKKAYVSVDLESNKLPTSGGFLQRRPADQTQESEYQVLSYPQDKIPSIVGATAPMMDRAQKGVFVIEPVTATPPKVSTGMPSQFSNPITVPAQAPTDFTFPNVVRTPAQDIKTEPQPIQDQPPILTPDIFVPQQPRVDDVTTASSFPVPTPNDTRLNNPTLFNPVGNQSLSRMVEGMGRGRRRGLYMKGITEYPVKTVEDIFGGKRKRK